MQMLHKSTTCSIIVSRISSRAAVRSQVRLYDENTGKLSSLLDSGSGHETTGHSNSVFALAWSDADPQLLVRPFSANCPTLCRCRFLYPS